MLELFMSAKKDGETTVDKMSLGTMEEKYLNNFSDYLTDDCGYVKCGENKYSLRIIDEDCSKPEEHIFQDWVRTIEVEDTEELGSVRPDNFDMIELPIGNPWGNINNNSYRKVEDGFWVANSYTGRTK